MSSGASLNRDGREADVNGAVCPPPPPPAASPENLRRSKLQLGPLASALGSCLVEFENTKVIVAVHGPSAPHRSTQYEEGGTVNFFVKYAPFARVGQDREENSKFASSDRMDKEEKLISQAVR